MQANEYWGEGGANIHAALVKFASESQVQSNWTDLHSQWLMLLLVCALLLQMGGKTLFSNVQRGLSAVFPFIFFFLSFSFVQNLKRSKQGQVVHLQDRHSFLMRRIGWTKPLRIWLRCPSLRGTWRSLWWRMVLQARRGAGERVQADANKCRSLIPRDLMPQREWEWVITI